ncbi:peptidoglycan-binding domain-containing protein [uncultured Ruegeria sp.]|uniref:peptidoglycan-binding domain-containing protein n=1 Tax=uncultured Ruegeria sp. TaxID=259304 RepID=UPI002602BCA9|nr:peptidoglycan-binding domain-containing protein [uncultured Ruegeria sp.]
MRLQFFFLALAFCATSSVATPSNPKLVCVQERLKELGYDAGPSDGLWGGKTARASQRLISEFEVFAPLPLPALTEANTNEWCEWFGGEIVSGVLLVESLDAKSFTKLIAITTGKAAELRLAKNISGEIAVNLPIFFHGDDPEKKMVDTDAIWVRYRQSIPIKFSVSTRPFSKDRNDWRQPEEWMYHSAVMDALKERYSWEGFSLFGHSGGGHLSMALAQQRNDVYCVVLAAPKLAVREHYRQHEGGVPKRGQKQYDPLDYDIPSTTTISVAYDLNDDVVKQGGVLPFVAKAENSTGVHKITSTKDAVNHDSRLTYLEQSGSVGSAHNAPIHKLSALWRNTCVSTD